ncbi:MAG TPA: DEAD/DEAH box helicase [Actinomycetes bacterium]|nr:DEAD/DEAH box helicase [Actinomycetes bacterium]
MSLSPSSKSKTVERSFADLGATAPTLTSLARIGIEHPFPIQTLCLPLALAGVDLIGQARTGTGKTLAFGIPIVQEVDPGEPAVQALVVVPTRELCLQVAADVEKAGHDAGIRVAAIVGGRPMGPQIVDLNEGAPVVVGTPGRLLDHLRQGSLQLDSLRVLVLDEADEMLDLGFLPDVETIIDATPPHRQTMLFSATMPKEVVALARRYSKQPTFVHAEPEGDQATVPATKQYFFQVHPLNRFEVLCRLLDASSRDRVAVFRRTKRGVERTIQGLVERGYKAGALHGDLPQPVRERVMRSFRKGKLDVLVCTDVAARGLDIAGLSHVINYDTPEDERAYVHRIGRTGRAGAAGVAITFAAWNETATAEAIREHLSLRDEPMPEVYSTSQLLVDLFDLPTVEEAAATRAAARAGQQAATGSPVDGTGAAPGSASKRRSGSRRRRRRLTAPRPESAPAAPAVAS